MIPLTRWSLGAALIVFVLGFAAGTCGRASSREIEAAHDSTTAAVERWREAEAARVEGERRDLAALEAAKDRENEALAVARASRARRPAIVERIIERAGIDSAAVRVAVEEVVDSLVQGEILPLRAALLAADSAGAAQGRLWLAEREGRQAANVALSAALAEVAVLRDARPSWFSRNAPRVAVPLAIVGGWYLRGAIGR